MGEFLTSAAVITPTAYGADDETDTNFPASNVGIYASPNEPYKSTVCTLNDFVGVDLGSSQTVAAVVVDNVNVAGVKIRGDDSALGDGAPDYDSGGLVVSQNPVDGRYKIVAFPAVSRRYWWVKSNAISTTDGAAAFSVGSIACLSAYDTWPHSITWGLEEIALQAVIKPQGIGGGGKPVAVGNAYSQLRLPGGDFLLNTLRTTLLKICRYGQHTPFWIYLNDGDTSNWYWVYRVGETAVRKSGYADIQIGGMLLENVVD